MNRPTIVAELAEPPKRIPCAERPGMVLLMLFAVLGPLALPMLWRSRRFSRFWKVVLTLAVASLTVLVVVALWWAVARLFAALADLRQLYQAAGSAHP